MIYIMHRHERVASEPGVALLMVVSVLKSVLQYIIWLSLKLISNESCDAAVRNIIVKMGVENVNQNQFVRCYFISNQQKIRARFQSCAERVWIKRFYLKGRTLFVSEDFSVPLQHGGNYILWLWLLKYYRNITKIIMLHNLLKISDKSYAVKISPIYRKL